MAVNPNTDFTSGSVLTADQQNRFPRGLMGDASRTTTYTLTNTITDVPDLSVTFTAVANRRYRAVFYCGNAMNANANASRCRIDLDLSGTVVMRSYIGSQNYGEPITVFALFNTTAGSKTFKVRAMFDNGVAADLFADTNTPMRCWVEDMGPY